MGLETGTYIDDLVATNPTAGDLKSQGDDHLRLIKATIKASFPNISGPATLTHTELSGVSTAFTGTPTAPTAAAADNSTQIATTAYVDAAFVAEAYPPVSGNTGKFLTNDGNITSWEEVDIASALVPYYTQTEIDANTYTQTWIDGNIYTKTEIDANTYTQTEVDTLLAAIKLVPPGAIIPFIGGYFGDGANGSFTAVHNTASAVNTLLNDDYGLYVADGSAVNISGSTYYDGSGRYLPNLTDDRFIMGDTAAGTTGGSSTMAHTHTTPDHTLSSAEIPSHSHGIQNTCSSGGCGSNSVSAGSDGVNAANWGTGYAGSGDAHNHGSTGAATNAENRPKFLACLYLVMVAPWAAA